MENSPTVDLVWQLACVETTAAKLQFIEPEHFLAALTKLKQFCTDEGIEKLHAEGFDASAMRWELALVAEVLTKVGIEPDVLRRELRARLGNGTHERAKGATLHRSDE